MSESIGFGTCNCVHPILEPAGLCAAQAGADVYIERSVLLAGLQELQGTPYTSPAGVKRARQIIAEARTAAKAAAASEAANGNQAHG